MGVHTYPCPTCYCTQKVRAQSGEIVTIKDCDACAQTKAQAAFNFGESVDKEVAEALDRYDKKRRA
jgi:ribosomal protein L37AE/L43A